MRISGWIGVFAVFFAIAASSHRDYVGTVVDVRSIGDDDIVRHRSDPLYFSGIEIREKRFSENGFNWHILSFKSIQKPDGPTWIVPHDDENAAFESMIAAIKRHGGVGYAVNSGQGSIRKQSGRGNCGGKSGVILECDPNRNFSDATPLFTNAILENHVAAQPVVALHTNTPGFGRGRGGITILDANAVLKGMRKPRKDGYFGSGNEAVLNDPDVYAILPYAATKGISSAGLNCRKNLNAKGVNVWHERVGVSDGSLSNYIALQRPDIAYVNAEAKRESDWSQATEAHRLMIEVYLAGCLRP